MFCAHCGKEIERNSKFCKHCGKAVTSAPTIAISKSQLNKIFAAIGAAIVVGAIAYIAIHLMYGSSTDDKISSKETQSSTKSPPASNQAVLEHSPKSQADEYVEYLKAVDPTVKRVKSITDSVNSLMEAYAQSTMTGDDAAKRLRTYFEESYKLDSYLQKMSVPNWLSTTHGHLTSACSSFTRAISTLQFAIEGQNMKTLNNYQSEIKYATSEMNKYNTDLKGYNATLKMEKAK